MTEPSTPGPAGTPVASVTRGLNAFSLALYGAISREGNTLLSPFSVAMALSLVELGARGGSAAALHRLLGASDGAAHRSALKALSARLAGGGAPTKFAGMEVPPHVLRFGNSVWVARGYALDPAFVPLAKQTYEAVAAEIDVAQPVQVAKQVNTWVGERTGGKIKEIIAPMLIDRLTRLILVNAVHFVGRWHDPFREEATKPAPFYVDGKDEPASVPTMATMFYFGATSTDDVTVLEMPYWGAQAAELAMTLVLPKRRDGLAAIEAKLTPALLEGWIAALKVQMVEVRLPRWKTESTAALAPVLKELGIGELFGDRADLSGISAEQGLHLSAVIHKTFINVDEKGTEAAAATSIMAAGSGMPPRPLAFHADHPYLYVIRDRKSGTLLFIGRVTDPR